MDYDLVIYGAVCEPCPVNRDQEVAAHHVVALTEVVVGAHIEAGHAVMAAAMRERVPVVRSQSRRGVRHIRRNVDHSPQSGRSCQKRTTTADMRVRSAVLKLLIVNLLVDNGHFSEL